MRLVVDTNILVSATIQGAMTRISKSNTLCVSGEPRIFWHFFYVVNIPPRSSGGIVKI